MRRRWSSRRAEAGPTPRRVPRTPTTSVRRGASRTTRLALRVYARPAPPVFALASGAAASRRPARAPGPSPISASTSGESCGAGVAPPRRQLGPSRAAPLGAQRSAAAAAFDAVSCGGPRYHPRPTSRGAAPPGAPLAARTRRFCLNFDYPAKRVRWVSNHLLIPVRYIIIF